MHAQLARQWPLWEMQIKQYKQTLKYPRDVGSLFEGIPIVITIKRMLTAAQAVCLLGGLAAVTAQASNKAIDDAIAERIAPVGKICIQGQECEAHQGLAVAAVSSGPRSGEKVFSTYCTACHSTGVLGAPKKGDSAAWKTRGKALVAESGIKEPLDALLKTAISGINAMPAKGTCADCSDEELKSAIAYMSGYDYTPPAEKSE